MITPFLLALQLLTRIPVKIRTKITAAQLGESVIYYPVVGFLIGSVLYGVMYLLHPISNFVSAAVVLCIWVIMTGGLHLDGLSDSADAWLGGTKGDKANIKARSFEIMKDPNCGPAGVFWIVIILILKFSALIDISHINLYVIILVPVIGRSMAVLLFLTTPYVNKNGLGSKLAKYLPHKLAYLILANVALGIIISNLYGTFIIIAVVFLMLFLRQIMINRIGGMTGDTAGAIIEISEAVSLMLFVIVLNVTY